MSTTEKNNSLKNPLRWFVFIASMEIVFGLIILLMSLGVHVYDSHQHETLQNYLLPADVVYIIGNLIFLYLYRKQSLFAWHFVLSFMIVGLIIYFFRSQYAYVKKTPDFGFILTIFISIGCVVYAIKQKSAYKKFINTTRNSEANISAEYLQDKTEQDIYNELHRKILKKAGKYFITTLLAAPLFFVVMFLFNILFDQEGKTYVIWAGEIIFICAMITFFLTFWYFVKAILVRFGIL